MSSDRLKISAKIIADSVYQDSRLVTFEVTFPRFVLAEFNTHRVISRNSASSRAIPVWKRLADIVSSPFVPLQFGKNKSGMQSTEEISSEDAENATLNWMVGRDVAVLQAFALAGGRDQILRDSKENPAAIVACQEIEEMSRQYPDVSRLLQSLSVGVHKQHANRVVEPYAWHTVIATGTRWRNFYALRASTMAQPEIQTLAIEMARVHKESTPVILKEGEWHLPFIRPEDLEEVKDFRLLAKISSARCGRVSYLTHDGVRSLDKDVSMADSLQGNGHMSPFEHPARTADSTGAYVGSYGGNFGDGWIQFRKTLPQERDFSNLISRDSLLLGMGGDVELADFVLSLSE